MIGTSVPNIGKITCSDMATTQYELLIVWVANPVYLLNDHVIIGLADQGVFIFGLYRFLVHVFMVVVLMSGLLILLHDFLTFNQLLHPDVLLLTT